MICHFLNIVYDVLNCQEDLPFIFFPFVLAKGKKVLFMGQPRAHLFWLAQNEDCILNGPGQICAALSYILRSRSARSLSCKVST